MRNSWTLHGTDRRRGAAMITIILSMSLLFLAAIAIQGVLTRSAASVTIEASLRASQIADSAAAKALARLKHGGIAFPQSGSSSTPSWEEFGEGQLYYYTKYDASLDTNVVRAWGRVAVDYSPSKSTFSPDSANWDGDGWVVEGVEIVLRNFTYFPETPLFVGNGGIERPMGGFHWSRGSDLSDPSTWGKVTRDASSYQSSSTPFEVSSLDHPSDYLTNSSATVTAVSTLPHPYSVWVSENPIGQMNVEAWFDNSAGSSADPTAMISPQPAVPYYDTSSSDSADYPYPVDTRVPDVQTYAWVLWNSYSTDPGANQIFAGSRSGTYGTLAAPEITFVTGNLTVDSGKTFEGTGILVIRDDYDPDVDTNNRPRTRAGLTVRGNFRWTGLVIVSGWAPTIRVDSGGDARIVGSLFGEDSVQSGGEVSLDSATIIYRINDDFKVHYSSSLFEEAVLRAILLCITLLCSTLFCAWTCRTRSLSN